MQPIQMQFSKIQKSFSHFVAAFLEFRLNFEHLEKKMTLIAYVFWKLHIAKDLVTQKSSFRRIFNKRPGKQTQTWFRF